MPKRKYDFSGWATKYNTKCSDGVTIAPGTFAADNGIEVPLAYGHNHGDIDHILGHAYLENRPEGVYAYCTLNDTDSGIAARKCIKNGDLNALSIYAGKLKRTAGNVITHGNIMELSLVMKGANPGALIVENLIHSDSSDGEFEATIYNDEGIIIHSDEDDTEDTVQHNEDDQDTSDNADNTDNSDNSNDDTVQHADEETVQDVFDSLNDKQKYAAFIWINAAMAHAGIEENDDTTELLNTIGANIPDTVEFTEEETVEDIVNTFNEKQKTAVEYIISTIVPDEDSSAEDVSHSDDQEDTLQHNEEEVNMKKNVFDQVTKDNGDVLTHDEFTAIVTEAKRNGSLKEAFIAHGITDVTNLFPEATLIGDKPAVINNDTSWVAGVLAGVKKSPFAKVKTIAVDVRGDNARAKGYVKGRQKVEEVISALKRTTDPQTVYKLQKMDRDDVIDITDFDVIAFLKQEMRGKLNEELARAILTGDGRSADSADKIFPDHIRPILGDSVTYTTAVIKAAATDQDQDVAAIKNAKTFIKTTRKSRREYKGSGRPDMYIDAALLDDIMLIEDQDGKFLYETEDQVARVLRVNKVIPVEYFAEVVRQNDAKTKNYKLQGIMVNLTDYTVGANKGGQVTMFDDFDLNFNKQEYLIETRVSGALTKPFSAVTFELESTVTPTEQTEEQSQE